MTSLQSLSREAFEAWATSEGYGGIDDMLSPLDRSLKALMWKVWQAAKATESERINFWRPIFSSHGNGRKLHVGWADNPPMCRVDKRHPHLLLESGDKQHESKLRAYLGSDVNNDVCQDCKRFALIALKGQK